MKAQHRSTPGRGVTLIEMMVGVAVLGVLLAVAIPSMTGMMERRRVVAAAGEIASILAQARAETTQLRDKVAVHLEPVPASVGDHSCIRLSTDYGTDVCRCNLPPELVCSLAGGVLLREYVLRRDSSVSFSATGNWNPGKPYVIQVARGSFVTQVDNVQVTVVGAKTQAKLRVDYNASGRVRTCSPDGSIGGFAKCGDYPT